MGTQRVQMKGVLPWLAHWALGALVGPVQNFLSGTVHYFNSFVPNAEQAGQAVVLGSLSLNKCICVLLWRDIFCCRLIWSLPPTRREIRLRESVGWWLFQLCVVRGEGGRVGAK
jgi:hypothetical protein